MLLRTLTRWTNGAGDSSFWFDWLNGAFGQKRTSLLMLDFNKLLPEHFCFAFRIFSDKVDPVVGRRGQSLPVWFEFECDLKRKDERQIKFNMANQTDMEAQHTMYTVWGMTDEDLTGRKITTLMTKDEMRSGAKNGWCALLHCIQSITHSSGSIGSIIAHSLWSGQTKAGLIWFGQRAWARTTTWSGIDCVPRPRVFIHEHTHCLTCTRVALG